MTPDLRAQLAALKEAAEKATPGPWKRLHDTPVSDMPAPFGLPRRSTNMGTVLACNCAQVWSTSADWAVAFCDTREMGDGFDEMQQMENAVYIATANPAAILSLISDVEAALAEARDEALDDALFQIKIWGSMEGGDELAMQEIRALKGQRP